MVVDTHDKSVLTAAAERDANCACLTRVRLRAQRRLLWMRSQLNQSQGPSITGLAISPEDVERILEDPVEIAAKEDAFYQSDAVARQLSEQIDSADMEFSRDPAWSQLRQQFALSDFETDLLSLSVAAGVDP